MHSTKYNTQSLSEQRIREYENNLIGASQKEAERQRRSIFREKSKTDEKLQILDKKTKFQFLASRSCDS